MNEAILIAIIALTGALIIKRLGFIDRLRGINSVNVYEAKDLISNQDAVILDVRTKDEYAAARIPEARHIPLRQMAQHLKELEPLKERPILVSCRSGSRSARACSYLKRQGFENVYNLRGGLVAWSRANLALES